MPNDEIETGNPGGVGKLPAARAARVLSEDLDYPQLRLDLPLVRRRGNLPAMLSAFGGSFALPLILVGIEAVDGPRWLAWLDIKWTVGIGCCLAGVAFLQGVLGMYPAIKKATTVAFLCSLLGIVTSALALYAAASWASVVAD